MPRFNYSYKPSTIFATRPNERSVRPDGYSARFFGVENELERVAGVARLVDEDGLADLIHEHCRDRVYCKRDGSLDHGGCEMVSHPATLGYHTYEANWRELFSIARKNGYRSHNAPHCGLHVHVNRDSLGHTTEEVNQVGARLLALLSATRADTRRFTRRTSYALDSWGSILHIPEHWTEADAMEWIVDHSYDHDDRYTALNFTNSSTLEFRIFRGTLVRDTFIATLQFVDNLCDYAMTHTFEECRQATMQDIVNVHSYAILNDYVVDARGILTREQVGEPRIHSSHRNVFHSHDCPNPSEVYT